MKTSLRWEEEYACYRQPFAHCMQTNDYLPLLATRGCQWEMNAEMQRCIAQARERAQAVAEPQAISRSSTSTTSSTTSNIDHVGVSPLRGSEVQKGSSDHSNTCALYLRTWALILSECRSFVIIVARPIGLSTCRIECTNDFQSSMLVSKNDILSVEP